MNQKTAKYISTIGHPLITIPLCVALAMFSLDSLKNAFFVTGILFFCIILPMVILIAIKTKRGSYTNFDVSDQKQRNSLFFFVTPLLIIVTFILYKSGQSKNICFSFFFGLILSFVSQIINRFIKCSMHVSLNIYLSFIIFSLNNKLGIILFICSVLIGWSRIVLKRHTLKEVIIGGGIGILISMALIICEKWA